MAAEQNAPVDVAAEGAEAPQEASAPGAKEEATPVVYFQLSGAEGQLITISQLAAEQSKIISDLLHDLDYSSMDAADRPTIPLTNIKHDVLVKIVEWCEQHKGEPVPEEDQNVPKQTVIPEWDAKFLEISDDEMFDLVIAANYLDIKRLLTYACKRIAMMAVGKTPEELRAIFEIPTDEEDERAAREAGGAAEPSTWESSTSGPSTSGPSTSGPSTSGPSTSGPSTSGPSTSGPSTSGPSTSGPSTSGPSTSGPSTSGPSTSSAQ